MRFRTWSQSCVCLARCQFAVPGRALSSSGWLPRSCTNGGPIHLRRGAACGSASNSIRDAVRRELGGQPRTRACGASWLRRIPCRIPPSGPRPRPAASPGRTPPLPAPPCSNSTMWRQGRISAPQESRSKGTGLAASSLSKSPLTSYALRDIPESMDGTQDAIGHRAPESPRTPL